MMGRWLAALQETKWFGSEVYQVGGSVVLTVGRERPSEGDDMQRGEGVAIVPWVQRLMHGKELEKSERYGVQEQSQHACR